MEIDVIVTGSSRPDLLEKTVNSFLDRLKTTRGFRFLLHEDCIFEVESEESIEWAKYSLLFDETILSKPHVGLGEGIRILLQKVKSPFLIYLQDDWELEREVDLDALIQAFEENNCINHVHFNKYKTSGSMNGFQQVEHEFSGIKMCLYNAWAFLPSVWRTKFVKPRFVVRYERPEGYFTNTFGNHEQRRDTGYCKRFMGCYIYGPQGDYRYLRHLGNARRMASWRLEGGRPGGREMPEEFDRKHAHPDAYRRIWGRDKPE